MDAIINVFLFLLTNEPRASLRLAQYLGVDLVDAQHVVLYDMNFINNRGHVGPLDQGQSRLGK